MYVCIDENGVETEPRRGIRSDERGSIFTSLIKYIRGFFCMEAVKKEPYVQLKTGLETSSNLSLNSNY